VQYRIVSIVFPHGRIVPSLSLLDCLIDTFSLRDGFWTHYTSLEFSQQSLVIFIYK